MVPDDVCVAVDDRLAPHLTRRDYVTLADAQYGTADFVARELQLPRCRQLRPVPGLRLQPRSSPPGIGSIFNEHGVMLLQSPHYTGPSAACNPFGPGKS